MVKKIRDRNSNQTSVLFDAQNRPEKIVDTLGRTSVIAYHAGTNLIATITDWDGRTTYFHYDCDGCLRAITTTAVTGTPGGANDFSKGKTTLFTYIHARDNNGKRRLLLTEVHYPNEVGDLLFTGSLQPLILSSFPVPTGPAAIKYAYANITDPAQANYMKPTSVVYGGTNGSGIASGGTISYSYSALSPQPSYPYPLNIAVLKTTVTDRKGFVTDYHLDSLGHVLQTTEYTSGLRTGDPPSFVTVYTYNADGQLIETILPEGNKIVRTWDDANTDVRQRGNLLRVERLPDATRAPLSTQSSLLVTYSYEPIFNQVRTMVDERGNDPTFVPPLGSQSAARYRTTYTFDYQEGTDYAGLALKIGGTATSVQNSLTTSGVPMGLGDLNGDTLTNQINGNVIRIQRPSVLLPADSSLPEGGGGTQLIEELMAYNQFGQTTYRVDSEGNVTDYEYYPENVPNGVDTTPAPPDGRTLDTTTGGYLKKVKVDNRTVGFGPPRRETIAPVQLITEYFYNKVGITTKVRDPRGIDTVYVVNQLNQVVETRRASSVVASAETDLTAFNYFTRPLYDRNDNVIEMQVENRDGDPQPTGKIRTIYVYDILNNRVEEQQQVDDTTFLITQFRYDANENQIKTILPELNEFTSVYDERDLLFTSTRGANDGMLASTSTYFYDKNGNQTKLTDGKGFNYLTTLDGFDRVKQTTDPVGNQAVNLYDPASNIIKVQRYGKLGGPSNINNDTTGNVLLTESVMDYDELNRIYRSGEKLQQNQTTQRTVTLTEGPLSPGNGFIDTRTDFDRSSRVVRTVDDAGHISKVEYDGANRTVKSTDGENNTVETFYDKNSNVVETKETDKSQKVGVADEVFLTTSKFDSLNRMILTVDNVGQASRFAYDSRDNMKETTDAQGPVTSATITRVSTGAVVSINDPGNKMAYHFDGLNRRTSTEMFLTTTGNGGDPLDTGNPHNPDGKVILTQVWDNNSRLKKQIDDKGNVTEYFYDALNRKFKTTYADSSVEQVTFDKNDNIATMTDENGTVRSCTYDQINRLTQCDVTPAAGVIGTTQQKFEYDGLSHITRCEDNNDPGSATDNAVVTHSYDSLSRMIEEVQSLSDGSSSKVVTSDWTADNLRTGLTYPNNRKLVYTFDNLDRTKTIKDFGAGVDTVSYNYIGSFRVLERVYKNNTRLTYLNPIGGAQDGYDALRRVVRHRHLTVANTVVAEFSYSYNRTNNRLFEQRHHDLDLSLRPKGERYVYDSLYRAIDFKEGRFDSSNNLVPGTETKNEAWTLDGVGNWPIYVKGTTTNTQTINSVNKYTSFGGVTNTHDANKNTKDDGTFLYEYDFLNRLRIIRRKSDSALVASYLYDAFNASGHMMGSGRRIRREITTICRGPWGATREEGPR